MTEPTPPQPLPPATPGGPYVTLHSAMQAFYARRGMWTGGEPRGLLAVWLGPRCPWKAPTAGAVFWTTPDGLAAMAADAEAAPPQAWHTYHQRGQFLRRLREAGHRAGGLTTMHRASMGSPAAPQPGQSPPRAFDALVCPPAGSRAHAAFVRHVGLTLRELVEFSQTSAWAADDGLSGLASAALAPVGFET